MRVAGRSRKLIGVALVCAWRGHQAALVSFCAGKVPETRPHLLQPREKDCSGVQNFADDCSISQKRVAVQIYRNGLSTITRMTIRSYEENDPRKRYIRKSQHMTDV